MRKAKYILLILLVICTTNVYAASASISTSKSSVYVGDTFKVSATVKSAASWNVHVTPTGPVSGCRINEADSSSTASNVDKTFEATCTATGTGTISLSLSGDVSGETDDRATTIGGSTSVRVTTRPAAPSTNTSTNTPSYTPSYTPNYTQANTPSNNTVNKPIQSVMQEDNKSTNTNLKSITIDNQIIEKVDNNNYKVTVNNNIDSVVIKVEAEDSKSKVEGAGKKDIKVGTNNIQIKITSESGAQNIYNLVITRKDSFYIDDLKDLLEDNTITSKNITIKQDTKLTVADLDLIADSGKLVFLNYIDESKKTIYTWVLDGTSIRYDKDFLTTVTYGSADNNEVLKAANYASGINITFGKNIPKSSKFKLYIKDAFDKKDKPNLYFYNENTKKMELINENIDLEDGFIEIENPQTGYYFVSLSNIVDSVKEEVQTVNYYLISTVGLLVILAIFIVFHFIREAKKSRKIRELEEEIDELEEQETTEEFEVITEETPAVAPEIEPNAAPVELAQEPIQETVEAMPEQNNSIENTDATEIKEVSNEEFNEMFETNMTNNTSDEMPALNIEEVKPANDNNIK